MYRKNHARRLHGYTENQLPVIRVELPTVTWSRRFLRSLKYGPILLFHSQSTGNNSEDAEDKCLRLLLHSLSLGPTKPRDSIHVSGNFRYENIIER